MVNSNPEMKKIYIMNCSVLQNEYEVTLSILHKSHHGYIVLEKNFLEKDILSSQTFFTAVIHHKSFLLVTSADV